MCHTTKRPKHVNKFLPTQAQSLSELRAYLQFPINSDSAVDHILLAMSRSKGKHATRKRNQKAIHKNYVGWTTIMQERSAA